MPSPRNSSMSAIFRAFPDSYTKVEHVFEDGEWAIIEWTGGGSFLGEFFGHAPTGRSFTLCGCGFFHVVGGKIQFQRGYWDKATWFSLTSFSLRKILLVRGSPA